VGPACGRIRQTVQRSRLDASWWRHLAPARSHLRGRGPGGFGGYRPLFVQTGRTGLSRYRLLGSGTSFRVEPLACVGKEHAVAALVMGALEDAEPRADLVGLEGASERSPWIRLLSETGASLWVHNDYSLPAPTLALQRRTFDEWFASKSANFRQQMRRSRRRLEEKGAVLRLATTTTTLRGPDRFRLWLMQVGQATISAQIFVAAGGEVSYWNGGFSEEWAAARPALVTILGAIEHSYTVGDKRLDLGGGGQAYKYRFADREEILNWSTLAPAGPRQSLARLSVVPTALRRRAANKLSPETKQRIKQVLRHRRRSPTH
jgi:CelD/BcsL family acetyltransferase involved in cellulose biosynthesis